VDKAMRIWPTKRWWKRIGLGFVFLLALALILNAVMSWRVEHQIQSRIAAIRASGEPASISDLAPKPVPESENAAAVMAKLGPRLDQFSKDYAKFDDTPAGKGYNARTDIGEPPTASQLQAIRAILDNYPDIDAGLAEVVSRDKYASLTDFSMNTEQFIDFNLKEPMGRNRTGSRFLRWRMEELTGAGQRDKAVAYGIEALKLARQYDNEPLMVNMLVAIAMRGIAVEPLYDALNSGPVSPEVHAALDKELAIHESSARVLGAMKTERGFVLDSTQVLPPVAEPAWLYSFIGWPIKRFYLGAVDYYDVVLAEVSRASKDGTAGRHFAEPDATGYGPLATLITPAVQAAFTADVRCTTQLRALRIFNALRQFAEKNGREATKLEELGLPAEALIDPFDGKPLKLKHTEDGWIVYTVMTNATDDGGDFLGMKDFGVAPPKWRLTEKPDSDAGAAQAAPAADQK
jgi:hypothetical protein